MPIWSSLSFQDANSPSMELIITLHDHIMALMSGVLVFVGFLMLKISSGSLINRGLYQSHGLESVWGCLPVFVLLLVAVPSLRALYACDEPASTTLSMKVLGHQWFWSYEYPSPLEIEFDTYITPDSLPSLRNLDTDNRVTLPYGWEHRLMVSASDVLHAWAIPALGVKIDAVPGRLNQVPFWLLRPGLFFGQCSEICGAQHSFMPIVVQSVRLEDFLGWAKSLT